MKKLIIETKQFLVWTEYCLLMVVFVMLFIAAVSIIFESVQSFWSSRISVITLLNNALLLLVIKEIIWSVFRFFNKERFTLSPFLYIGVISSVREILFLSIKNSLEQGAGLNFSIEILINTVVIFILVAAYYLFKKARVIAGEDS